MDDKPFQSLNMVPFIDIMLVLLTIVLTTSSFVISGQIPINLPQAAAESEVKDLDTTVITLDEQGRIFFREQLTSLELLKQELSVVDKQIPVLIRADKIVQLQAFIDVVGMLKQLHLTNVAVQTENSQQ